MYYETRGKHATAGNNDVKETIKLKDNTNALRGKQRNTFGKYLVMNKNLGQIEIWGYTIPTAGELKLTKIFTSTANTSVEYLGAHEFYWWPYKSFLFAKLSDGTSF